MRPANVLLAAGILVMLSATLARGGHGTFSESGAIVLPAPFCLGVTGSFGLCDPESALQDLDGHWYELPAGFADGTHPVTLTPGEELTDVDALFYDANCVFIDDFTMARQSVGVPESSTIPEDTAFIFVCQLLGIQGTFLLTSP